MCLKMTETMSAILFLSQYLNLANVNEVDQATGLSWLIPFATV